MKKIQLPLIFETTGYEKKVIGLSQLLQKLIGGATAWNFSALNGPMGKNLPSGKLPHNYGKSPFLMGKSTISMVNIQKTMERSTIL